VKPIGNGSMEQSRPPQVQATSESDFITRVQIIELEGLLWFSITCCLCLIIFLLIYM